MTGLVGALLSGVLLLAAAPPSPKTPCDLLVTGGWVLTMDSESRVLVDGGVAIGGGAILAVGPAKDLQARFEPRERLDRPGAAILPGFVNTHTHAAMSLLRGIANDQPLMEWLQKSIFPAEAKNVTPQFVIDGTELACLEMIRSGTTTFADMYYFESDVASAVDRAGLRAVLGETWLDFPAPGHKDLAETKKVTLAFIRKWKGHPRITPAIAPHAPYTCSRETLEAVRDMAEAEDVPILTHLSETQAEQKQIREAHGMTPAAWLDSLGLLGPRLCAAHGVWLDADDLALLAKRKVSLSHNPESNMMLGSGIAPIVLARKAGVVVGLGTDGVAGSNNDLEMTEAMDIAGKLAKVKDLDPTALSASDLLRMATIDGARALGLGEKTGSLEPSKRADLIAIDLTRPGLVPIYDVASAIVYDADGPDVSLTVVDGRVLFDGTQRTLDPEAVVRKAKAWAVRIRASLGRPAEVR